MLGAERFIIFEGTEMPRRETFTIFEGPEMHQAEIFIVYGGAGTPKSDTDIHYYRVTGDAKR